MIVRARNRLPAYNGRMSDFIFVSATLVFFAGCVLYVHGCDKIIGPDDFPAPEVQAPDVAAKP